MDVTAPIAAKVMGMSRRQFDRLVTAGVLPRKSAHVFDLLEVGPAYLQYIKDGRAGSTTLAEAKLLLVQAQHRSLEQRTEERTGELVELLEVRRVFNAAMASIGAQLDGLAGRCAAELAAISEPAIVRDRLAQEIHRVRTSAANELAALSNRPLRGEDPDTAAAEDG